MTLFIIAIILCIAVKVNSNKESDFYYEHQREIDAYEERHKDALKRWIRDGF